MSAESEYQALSVAAKVTIGQDINSGLAKPYHHPLRASVSAKTLYSYAKKVKNHLPLMEREGRPSLLDEEGFTALRKYLADHNAAKVATLRSHIHELQLQTYCKRRRIDVADITEEESPRKLSKRIVIRYVRKLVPEYSI